MCWNEVNELIQISLPVWAVCIMRLAPVLSNGRDQNIKNRYTSLKSVPYMNQ